MLLKDVVMPRGCKAWYKRQLSELKEMGVESGELMEMKGEIMWSSWKSYYRFEATYMGVKMTGAVMAGHRHARIVLSKHGKAATLAYVGWLRDSREELRTDRIADLVFGFI